MSKLVHVTRGVWRPAESVAEFTGRVAAVLAALPEGTVVGGVAAARVPRLWLPLDPTDTIDVIVHPEVSELEARSYNRRPGVRARRQTLRPDEVTISDGIPITTYARTWLDLAAVFSPPDLLSVGDCILSRGTDRSEFDTMLARARHRRGVVRARAIAELLDGRSRSRPESHLRYIVVSAGLPAPQVNEAIYDRNGEWLGEPDVSWDDVRLALEYNGADHVNDVGRMRRDITRAVDIGDRGGWLSVTFGPAEVFGHPDQVATYVRRLRLERAHLLRHPR